MIRVARRGWLLLLLGGLSLLRAWPGARAQPEVTTLPLFLHVAQADGAPAADRALLDGQLARANRIFAPYGVRFAVSGRAPLPAPHARMETRADRDALATRVQPKVINVFVVASLRDVDEPERMRNGVHWHSRSHRPAHYVILSAAAPDFVLAHELGHFLGNPRHDHTPDNLMSYRHAGGRLFLNRTQQARVRRAIRTYLERGELEPVRAGAAESDAQLASPGADKRSPEPQESM